MTTPPMTPLDLTPAPAPAPLGRMLTAQAGLELRLTLRRGESVLLTLIIPLALGALLLIVVIAALVK